MANDTPLDEPASRSFVSQGLTLRYVDWGNTSAPPLLLLHGNRDHARSWDWTAQALKDRWHVVALDLRGHGDSHWSPDGAYLLPYHLLDLIEMVEALGEAKVSIVAHSFGGVVAARYAGLFPDRVQRIVFVDSLGPDPATHERWREDGPVERSLRWIAQRRDPAQRRQRTLASLDEAAARMQKANPRLSNEHAQHLALHGTRRVANGYQWKFDPQVSMFAPEDFPESDTFYWRAITAPTLILHGRDSWKSDPLANGRAAHFRNATTLSFDNAGHWLHHDRHDAFVEELKRFL